METQAYLFFDGRCEEAVEFYKTALGAEVGPMIRFKESPDQSMVAPGTGEKIMHGQMNIGKTTILVSDGRCTGNPGFQGFAMSITVDDPADCDKLFNPLAESGQIQMPLMETFFAKRFGMVIDKFGVMWMVIKPAHEK